MKLVSDAEGEKIVNGNFMRIGLEIQRQLSQGKSTGIAMNIDGATAVIFGELGFAPPLARGLFCLSRSVGILAHAWEQKNQGGRNKGPTPPEFLWNYSGKNPLEEG
jgi:citrate synthase